MAKREAPREQYESVPLSQEEVTEIARWRREELPKLKLAKVEKGFEMSLQIFSCTIEGDEIRCSVRVDGIVERPEAHAIAKGQTVQIAIPAKVTLHD